MPRVLSQTVAPSLVPPQDYELGRANPYDEA